MGVTSAGWLAVGVVAVLMMSSLAGAAGGSSRADTPHPQAAAPASPRSASSTGTPAASASAVSPHAPDGRRDAGAPLRVSSAAPAVEIANFSVGTLPSPAVYDPANGLLYVANTDSGNVSVINGTTNQVVRSVPVGTDPETPCVVTSTDQVFVPNFVDRNVSVISGVSNTVVANVVVGTNPIPGVCDNDNGEVYIPNEAEGSANLSVIASTDDKVVANVPAGGAAVGGVPATPGLDSLNDSIWVPIHNASGYLEVVSGRTNTIVATILLAGTGYGTAASPIQDAATPVFDPANGDVYVSRGNLYTSSPVAVFDGATYRLLATPHVGGYPSAPAYDPVNGDLYVSNYATETGDNVTVISGASNTVVANVPVGAQPLQPAVDTANGNVFVPNLADSNLSVLSGATNDVLANVRTTYGAGILFQPETPTFDPSVHELFVPGGFHSVAVFGLPSSTVPSLLLSPGIAPAGATVTASGSDFAPGKVTVTLGPPATELGTAAANATGSFQLSFSVPALPPGSYTVTGTDINGASAAVAFTIAAPISAVSGTTQQITTNPAGSLDPAISGDIVSYTSFETGTPNVFYVDLADDTPTEVTDALMPDSAELSDVSGGTLVYVDFAPLGEVQGYRIGGSSNPLEIAPSSSESQTTPSIGGSLVAWEQTTSSNTFQVWTSNLSTGTTADLTPGLNATQSAYIPQVSGDRVAYCEETAGGSQVIVADLATATSTSLATGCNELLGLGISGPYVVYGHLEPGATQTDLGLYDLATGTGTYLAPPPGTSFQNPHLSGDWISFDAVESSPTGSYSSVLLYNLATGAYYVVAPGTDPENSAFLSALSVTNGIGRVAYTDDASGVDQVYVFQFTFLNAPTISAAPTTVNSGASATLSVTAPPGGGTPPYTCEWQVEPPGSDRFSDLASSDCSSPVSTGPLSTGGWSFELNVTDSVGASVESNVATVAAVSAAQTTTIPIPGFPFGVAVDPVTNTVYTTNAENTVSVISGATDQVVDTLPVGDDPEGIAVDPVTDTVYVVNYGSSNVSVISGVTDQVTHTIAIGDNNSGPEGIAVDPVTDRVYVGVVNGALGGNVVVIDGATDRVVATIPTPGFGQGLGAVSLAVDPTTDTVYVQDAGVSDDLCSPAGSSCSPMYVISGATDTVTASVSLPPDTGGNYPFKAAADPATDTVYVVDPSASATFVVGGATDTLSGSISDGSAPVGVAVDPATDTIYVSDLYDDSVYLIAGASNEVVETVPVGDAPAGIAVDPVTGCAYVANSGDLTVSVIASQGDLAACSATPPTTTYDVSLVESGLPHGTTWYVNVTGSGSLESSSDTIGVALPNGTYTYTVATTDKTYAAAPGSFQVAGGPTTVAVSFTRQLYRVAFLESGIPARTLAKDGWTVVVAGDAQHDLLSQAAFLLPNGTYPLLVTGPSGYVLLGGPALPVSVAGPTTEALAFEKGRTLTLTFREKGLPAAQPWSVAVDDAPHAATKASLRFLNLTAGTYRYAVVSPLGGQNITQRTGRTVTYGPIGAIDLTGSSVVTLGFAYRYAVTFTETGAPTGSWSVTVRGVTHGNATDAPISFALPNGTYAYKVGSESGYSASGHPARAKVDGGPVSVAVTFKLQKGSEPAPPPDLGDRPIAVPSAATVGEGRGPRAPIDRRLSPPARVRPRGTGGAPAAPGSRS